MKRTKALWLGLGCLAAVGCGGDDNIAGGTSGKTLISSSTAPADATCPNGGTKLSFGTDTNDNGVLDPNEITGTQEICNGSGPSNTSSPPTLTTVTPTGADSTCANGGVIVKSGPDTNGNGKLDDSEVTQTQEICSGGNSAVLSITTSLDRGNASCPLGGTQTQSGPDNGNGGGTAGDGILQAGEVTNTTYACVNTPGSYVGSFTPPPDVAGQQHFKIDVHGGAGSAGAGGGSSGVEVDHYNTRGGGLKVFKTGKADASFTMPSHTPNFGATKLDITTDTVLTDRTDDGAGAADDSYYEQAGSLYHRVDSGNAKVPVTGLHVAATKTLTYPDGVMTLNVPGDVVIDGNLSAAHDVTGNSTGLILNTSSVFIGAAGAKISSAGLPQTNAAGGSADPLEINAALILNQATLDATGADGGVTGSNNGGQGGYVRLNASGAVYNSGPIHASGGNGTGGGNGGVANELYLYAGQGGFFNSGAITAKGGNGSGDGGNGGTGPELFVYAEAGGGLYNSGAVDISGGDASSTCTGSCSGGEAYTDDQIYAYGGPLVMSADFVAHGGKSSGTTGGQGGELYVYSYDTYGPTGLLPVGSMTFSGNITLSGGDGATGGEGGYFYVELRPSEGSATPLIGQEIDFLGYTDILANGGDGTTGGGSAGLIELHNRYWDRNTHSLLPTGAIVNYANLKAFGGAATTSNAGGDGAYVILYSPEETSGVSDSGQLVYNAGNIDTSGGSGVSGGGSAGGINIEAIERVDNTGTLTAIGGLATGAGATGGSSNGVNFNSGGGIGNTGSISANGGASSGANGIGNGGGSIYLGGHDVTNTKALSANGGNSNGVTGGGGGSVQLASSSLVTANTGALTVGGGTGTPNGTAGSVTIDGILQ